MKIGETVTGWENRPKADDKFIFWSEKKERISRFEQIIIPCLASKEMSSEAAKIFNATRAGQAKLRDADGPGSSHQFLSGDWIFTECSGEWMANPFVSTTPDGVSGYGANAD